MTSRSSSKARSSTSTRGQRPRAAKTLCVKQAAGSTGTSEPAAARSSSKDSKKRSAESSAPGEGCSVKKTKASPGTAPDVVEDRPDQTLASTSSENVTTATTFGIEFEFVLAFHETELDFAKDGHIKVTILKDLEHNKHDQFLNIEHTQNNKSYMCRFLWPSWLLRVPVSDEAFVKGADRRANLRESEEHIVRRYSMEPLLVARRALNAAGLSTVNVIGWMDKPHVPLPPSSGVVDPLDPDRAAFLGYSSDVLLRSMVPDYSKWTLTNDYTLAPVRRTVLRDRLRERSLGGEIDSWDSYGLELITRVMRFDELDSSIDEVDRYLSALTRKPKVDILENVWTTTHAHIGFNAEDQAGLSYRFFQHVAFLLLSYEPLVTMCFPRRCSGIKLPKRSPLREPIENPEDDGDDVPPVEESEADLKAADIEANDQAVKKAEEEYTGDDVLRSNSEYMREKLAMELGMETSEVAWHHIRNKIFDEKDNLAELMRMMQKPALGEGDEGKRERGYIVNWCNIYKIWTGISSFKNFKPTLEFRQHNCVTDAAEIKHWVLLLQAVMKSAREKVHQTTKYGSSISLDQDMSHAEREGDKYPAHGMPQELGSYVTLVLGLDQNEKIYWENRYEKFKNDRPGV